MRAKQRQSIALPAVAEALAEEAVKLAVNLRKIRDAQRYAELPAAGAHDFRDALLLLVEHAVCPGLYYAGFFGRNFLDGIAENGGMVESDIHYSADLRCVYDIRRVTAAAESDLEHHDVTAGLFEIKHGRRGHQLKLRRMVLHSVGGRLHARHDAGEHLVPDLLAVYLHTLVKAVEIRRSEQARFVTRGLQHRRGHRRAAAFAVRAGDVYEFHALLWLAELHEQLAYPVKPGPRAEPFGFIYIFKGFLIVHMYHFLCSSV